MIKANLRDGRTLTFDLSTVEGAEAWQQLQASPEGQQQLSGLAVLHNGTLHTLPTPKHFSRIAFMAERVANKGVVVGERISCQADDIELSLMVYSGSQLTRVDLRRIGKPRHLTPGRPWPQRTPEG